MFYFQSIPSFLKRIQEYLLLRRISCHGKNYSQPYFFKRNQSSDNRSHGFGAKLLLKKLSSSDFSYERKYAFSLSCRCMYDKLLHTIKVTPTSVQYWNEKIDYLDEYEWKQIFMIPQSATIESYTRSFQYRILNNALFLNQKLFTMKLVDSPLCSLCKNHDETPIHLFCDCEVIVNL